MTQRRQLALNQNMGSPRITDFTSTIEYENAIQEAAQRLDALRAQPTSEDLRQATIAEAARAVVDAEAAARNAKREADRKAASLIIERRIDVAGKIDQLLGALCVAIAEYNVTRKELAGLTFEMRRTFTDPRQLVEKGNFRPAQPVNEATPRRPQGIVDGNRLQSPPKRQTCDRPHLKSQIVRI
jgi:hypothetical protein